MCESCELLTRVSANEHFDFFKELYANEINTWLINLFPSQGVLWTSTYFEKIVRRALRAVLGCRDVQQQHDGVRQRTKGLCQIPILQWLQDSRDEWVGPLTGAGGLVHFNTNIKKMVIKGPEYK